MGLGGVASIEGSTTDTKPEKSNEIKCKIPNIEKFQQTFQKTSQIYKYLKQNWQRLPLYLIRTLSYVIQNRPHRIKRRTRSSESVDVICNRLRQAALASKSNHHKHNSNHLTHNNNNTNNNNNNNNNKINSTNGSNKTNGLDNGVGINTTKGTGKLAGEVLKDGRLICYYTWVCNDPQKTSQKTWTYGFRCAFCTRDFWARNSLMTHLRTSHQRCNFLETEEPETGIKVIEMTLNPSFDGSYCGFKYPGHNITRDFSFRPSFPTPRDPCTQLIFFRTRVKKVTADAQVHNVRSIAGSDIDSEDFEPDVDICSGRLYYHTSTCLPIKPNEDDIDSEADMDPEWLRERTQLMIDEFTDVNEGEKEILKLWNIHIMKNYKYKGDQHLRQACLDFIETEGLTILSKNLSKNFALHLANLFDFGLISSADLLECVRKLRKLKPARETRTIISPMKSNGKRTTNEHCQHSPPAKRALYNN